MWLCKMQMAKDLFLLKKALYVLSIQKKTVPLQTFLYSGDYALVISDGCEAP